MINKGKTIKEKGIALCHESQGYSANLRPVSLLMKSDLAPEQLTTDVVKALRQVTVAMSFEEFLRKFFGVWYDDAELLAKLLGFETEMENKAAENPDDEWIQAWNTEQQERLESKMEAITIAKAAEKGEELDLVKQYELLKLQQLFEKGVAEQGYTFAESGANEGTQATEVEKTAGTEPTTVEKTNETKETSVSDTQDVTKSQAYIDLMKRLEDAEARNAQADDIIKAAVETARAEALVKAKGFTFAEDADHEGLVTFMLEKANAPVVALLEKANARIAELVTEVADVRKEFGAAEHGRDGDASVADTDVSPEDVIKANVEKALAKAREAKQ